MPLLAISRDDDIAIVTIDNPPVNALSQPLRQALWQAVDELSADPAIRAVVLACAGRTFIAGADVGEFGKPPVAPHLPDLVQHIEDSPKPWIAAIHGSALGGGFEIALGCRFRLAAQGTSVGLPEVTLGIVPGASGTVRTPRLAGAAAAVDLVTSGRPVKADKALALGLVDAVIAGDLVPQAVAFAREALSHALPLPVSQRPITPPVDGFWDEQAALVARQAKGAAAPARALACVRKAVEAPLAQALAFERETFLDLRASDQAAALRALFFAERAAPRPARLKEVAPLPVASVGVVGGGTMGVGIAAAFCDAGLPVILIEQNDEAVQRALANLDGIFQQGVKRGKLTPVQAQQRMARVTGTVDYAGLAGVDLVIEAVFEDIAVKQAVFERLVQVCAPDAVLATNTSYLDPRLIAAGLANPARFIGLHFFSPANLMKLLEIIPVPETAPATLSTAFAVARLLGKVPVQAGICEGFIGNRILKRYRAAAERLVEQGVAVAQIDDAMRAYGFAMGPFEAQDLGGLDIAFLQREGARALGETVPETLGDLLVQAGRKGRKTGAGWYDYDAETGQKKPSAMVAGLIAARTAGSAKGWDHARISTHLVHAMAQEGEAILAQGIATSASDIDLVEIHGYGFPRWRGGPMFAAASVVRTGSEGEIA